MKFSIVSLFVLGIFSLNTELAQAHGKRHHENNNNDKASFSKVNGHHRKCKKDGICVINRNTKDILCVGGAAKGNSEGFDLVSGKRIACHTKKDAQCQQAVAEFVNGSNDNQVVVRPPEVKPEPVKEPIVVEPVKQEPNNTVVIACDPFADRTCQSRLAELKRLEQAQLAQEEQPADVDLGTNDREAATDISASRLQASTAAQ